MSKPRISTSEPVTPAQLHALRRFAGDHGYRWKAELTGRWTLGWRSYDSDRYGDDLAELQTLRNTRGQGWLFRFKFPEEVQ